MCRAVTCKTCKRPSWAGCGAHVEQVLRNVPESERCQCRSVQAASTGPSWLQRLWGRSAD